MKLHLSKRRRGIIVISTLIILAIPFWSALAAPTSYKSCFQLQNLESSTANITIDYYAQGNPTPTSVSDTIAGDSSNTYCPLSAVSSGFDGSVVISSDKPVAAITNVTGGATAWSAYDASYAGFTTASTTVNLPLLMNDNWGFDTWFNVQNAGGSGTANITINYSDAVTVVDTIDLNQAITLDQTTEGHASGWVGAATITSDQPIVATVMEVGPDTMPMLFGYNGFVGSSQDPVMPLVMANNWGFSTGIQVQNTGGSSTTITLSYEPSLSGTACTQSKAIAAGSSETFALSAWDIADPNSDNDCVNGEMFVGSAAVTSNSASMELVGIVNQHNFSTNKGAAYGAFDPSMATDTVVLPLIMDRNWGYNTGFNIMNVGTSSTDVSCTFSGTSYSVGPTTLAPSEALTDTQGNNISDSYVGSAVCTATASGKIIGVVNELLNTGTEDTFLVYEGFNK